MLWGWPTISSREKPAVRVNTALPDVILPLASVVEKNSSSIPNGDWRDVGAACERVIASPGELPLLIGTDPRTSC